MTVAIHCVSPKSTASIPCHDTWIMTFISDVKQVNQEIQKGDSNVTTHCGSQLQHFRFLGMCPSRKVKQSSNVFVISFKLLSTALYVFITPLGLLVEPAQKEY